MRRFVVASALIAALPLPALAGELQVFGGAALSFSSGAANKDTREDLNLYVEGEFANVYAGLSGDVYNKSVNDVIDLYLGYRNTTAGGLSYDVSYDRSFYPNDGGNCCGDINANLSIPLGAKLSTKLDTNYYPESQLSDAHLSLDYALNDKVTLTGKIGIETLDGGGTSKEFQLAAAYQLGDKTAVKVHYYKGDDYKGYIGLDLTWDTTILGGGSGSASDAGKPGGAATASSGADGGQ